MIHEEDTIYAPATPSGGAISVIRISGQDAHAVLGAVFSRRAEDMPHAAMVHGRIVYEGKAVDDAMAVKFCAPRSYTGENMAEVHCHGGRVTMAGVMRALGMAGARMAAPGEFTKRAFLNGKMDLSAAGAVMELIEAHSAAGAGAALRQLSGGLHGRITAMQKKLTDALAIIEAGIEYPEDDIEADIRRDALPLILAAKDEAARIAETFASGRMLTEGYGVVIAGRPNVGKSSLFNMLLDKERAIVTHIAGTTRDAVDDTIIRHGVPVRLTDTAGIRKGEDVVEKIGIDRAHAAAQDADLVLFVVDGSSGIINADRDVFAALGENVVVVVNKCDLPQQVTIVDVEAAFGKKAVAACAISGKGRDDILAQIHPPEVSEAVDVVITNARHHAILEAAVQSLGAAADAFDTVDLDCVTIDIKEAWDRLGEITGVSVTEEIIDQIFDAFCLGK